MNKPPKTLLKGSEQTTCVLLLRLNKPLKKANNEKWTINEKEQAKKTINVMDGDYCHM